VLSLLLSAYPILIATNLSGGSSWLAGVMGGGAYWAGRAAVRPLFSPCGQSLFFARPLYVVENLYFVVVQQLAIIGCLGERCKLPQLGLGQNPTAAALLSEICQNRCFPTGWVSLSANFR